MVIRRRLDPGRVLRRRARVGRRAIATIDGVSPGCGELRRRLRSAGDAALRPIKMAGRDRFIANPAERAREQADRISPTISLRSPSSNETVGGATSATLPHLLNRHPPTSPTGGERSSDRSPFLSARIRRMTTVEAFNGRPSERRAAMFAGSRRTSAPLRWGEERKSDRRTWRSLAASVARTYVSEDGALCSPQPARRSAPRSRRFGAGRFFACAGGRILPAHP
jgi:hypothetical protein